MTIPTPRDPSIYPTVPLGPFYALDLPTMDFETYSEAGYIWNPYGKQIKATGEWLGKWEKLGPKGGLSDVGGWAYAAHESTEVITLNYDLRDGKGVRRWNPYIMHPPYDLLEYMQSGGLMEAHNAQFEFAIWTYVCVAKYGWPRINILQMRDSAAKAASWALPRALEGVGNALNLSERKDTEGGALSKKLWMPRTPTVKDRRTRFYRHEEPEMFERNDQYCDQDVIAEQAVSHATPELHPFEQKVYEHDLQVAERGIHIDINAVDNAIEVFHQAEQKYAPELVQITGGAVKTANSHAALKKWLHANGAPIPNTQADTVDEWVSDPTLLLEPHVHRVLVIRQMLGSASVKKLFAMKRCRMPDGRARGALKFCGASTGRWAGSLFQPHNFPNSGPEMVRCTCGTSYCEDVAACPSCGQSVHKCRDCGSGVPRTEKKCGCGRKVGADEWTYEDMLEALERFNTRSLEIIEAYYGNASKVIAGCLRGMLCAGPGKDLICSDYSAIEARVIAAIARENWRLDAFRDGKDIYLESASQMLHTPYETYTQYKKENDAHHPHRKKGKVAELALGYGGGENALVQFGADKFMTAEEMSDTKRNWRNASPNICQLWYGLEEAAVNATIAGMKPGAREKLLGNVYDAKQRIEYSWLPTATTEQEVRKYRRALRDCNSAIERIAQCMHPAYSYNGITYGVADNVLYCRLPSGRCLAYHQPWVNFEQKPWGGLSLSLFFMGCKEGSSTFKPCSTWGGTLVENVVQAAARDLLAYAMLELDKAGYPIVLHVHDEVIAEVPEGWGSVEEFERLMASVPDWASDWPVTAAGGWRRKRYGKD